MVTKKTDDLMQQLKSGKNIDDYIKENEQHFSETTVAKHLTWLFHQKKIVKAQAFKRAEMQDIYAHQILSGVRKPSREKFIALCIGMDLNLEEIQHALKVCSFAPLYPKRKQDSIIIAGIQSQKSVCQINEMLYDNHEKTLS